MKFGYEYICAIKLASIFEMIIFIICACCKATIEAHLIIFIVSLLFVLPISLLPFIEHGDEIPDEKWVKRDVVFRVVENQAEIKYLSIWVKTKCHFSWRLTHDEKLVEFVKYKNHKASELNEYMAR